MKFSEIVKSYQVANGLSTRQFSIKLGISRKMLLLISEGYYEFPSDNLIKKFANATGNTFEGVMDSLTFETSSKSRTKGTSHQEAFVYFFEKTHETFEATKKWLISEGEEIEYFQEDSIIITKSNKYYEIFRHFNVGEDRLMPLNQTVANFILLALYIPRYQNDFVVSSNSNRRQKCNEYHLVFYNTEEHGIALNNQIDLPPDDQIKIFFDDYEKTETTESFETYLMNVRNSL